MFSLLRTSPLVGRLVGLFFLSLLMISGCSPTPEIVIEKITGPTMGTEYHISWVNKSSAQYDEVERAAQRLQIQQGVDEILSAINESMSTYDQQSELSLLNSHFTPEWQTVTGDLYRVLSMAMEVHDQSMAAFDVTVGPLVNLWGFGPEKHVQQPPQSEEIQAKLQQVGAGVIRLRQRDGQFQLKLQQPRYIDLSAIAKGYAVDVIGQYLSRQGIDDYLVEVGGEIIAQGNKALDTPWRIAVEAPNDQGRSAQMIIPLSNMGVATSGDYRNFFQYEGNRFSHTIDGRTGYPVKHGLASVSVLHESVAMADAWATALTVLGVKEGLVIAEQLNLAAFFIQRTDNGFEQYTSSQFKQLRKN